MLTQTKIALTAALFIGPAGVAQTSTLVPEFTLAQAYQGLGATGGTGSNTLSTLRPSLPAPSGVNPNNSQDMMNRGNRQDMTVPRARNPQDLTR